LNYIIVYKGYRKFFQGVTEKNPIGCPDLQMIFRCRQYLFYELHNVQAGSKLFFEPNRDEIKGFQTPSIGVYY
jgi:hypothetical protein